MNKDALLKIKKGVEGILSYIQGDLKKVSETESRFSARASVEIDKLEELCANFGPVPDLFELIFTLNIQHGEGNLKLMQKGLEVLDWAEDPDLSPPQLDEQTDDLYQELSTQLNEPKIDVGDLISMLNRLSAADASIEIELKISVDKHLLIEKIGSPSSAQTLIYIYSDKFIDTIENSDFIEFSKLIMPQKKDILLFFFADINGAAFGSNTLILGLDSWITGLSKLQNDESVSKKITDATLFRNSEVNWEGFDSNLTPHHLYVEMSTLSSTKVINSLAARLCMISVLYLANQAKVRQDHNIECYFNGYKKVRVLISPSVNNPDPIIGLFKWSFDNSSSDKLDIVRHIITLRVSSLDTEGYNEILNSASEILESAKDNFQVFIKQSVQFYFDTRVKISDYLQKFNEDVGSKISSLASQLIENLYKTVGIILGAAIAIVLDPKYTYTIILFTSILYFFYILFIFFVLLGTTYMRFSTNVKEYDESFRRFGDVFSKSEVEKLKGNTFQRAKWGFLTTYTVVGIIYGLLGGAALLLAKLVLKVL